MENEPQNDADQTQTRMGPIVDRDKMTVASGCNSASEFSEAGVVAALQSDVGQKRDHNEDGYAYCVPGSKDILDRFGTIFAVADGMGGAVGGEIASQTALETLLDSYFLPDGDDDDQPNTPDRLRSAVERANNAITRKTKADPSYQGMGTTLSAVVIRGRWAHIAQVGDSRAYLIRRRRIYQLTEDHSLIAEQVRRGLLSEEEAEGHTYRNIITRALGIEQNVEVDLFALRLLKKDTLVLCSDGLHGVVNDSQILSISDSPQPSQCCKALIEKANSEGGPDNITVGILRIARLDSSVSNNEGIAENQRLIEISGGFLDNILNRWRK